MIDLELECPCCHDIAASVAADGEFIDGAPLECGCSGWVQCDADEAPAVFLDPDGCDRCGGYTAVE